VWEVVAGGQARAVHHIESPAMISLCKMCNVRDIDTLIAIVSVIRPGAANESKKMEFARRYQGLSPVRYPHPSLEACLRSTYGLVVYEEHILQICEAFAGLRVLPRADRAAFGRSRDTRLHSTHCQRVVSIYGGKLTAYRATAARVTAMLRAALPARERRSRTEELRIDDEGDRDSVPSG